jgi:hypothetical protein
MNVFDRSVPSFTKTLEYDQAAPIGFLLLQKAVFEVFGMNDRTTRVIPFLFGLATVPLGIFVSKRIFGSRGPTVALVVSIGLICLNRSIATYSSLAKQYTLECFITLLLVYILSQPLLGMRKSVGHFSKSDWLVILSPVLVWFSYGAVFILVGFGVALVSRALVGQDRATRSVTLSFCVAVVLNLVVFFAYSARSAMANRSLAAWWAAAYMPIWPPSLAFSWLFHTFTKLGEVVIQTRLALLLPLGLVVTSVSAIWQRAWFWLACLASILACLCASVLGKYPFADRLLIFLIPIMVLMLAKSVDMLDQRWSKVSVVTASLILLAAGARLINEAVIQSKPIDRVREVHREMVAKFAPGDNLWVAPLSQPCFRYYVREYPLPEGASVHLLRPAETPMAVSRGRNWLLVIRFPKDPGEGERLLDDFSRLGEKKESFEVEWTTARLFVMP